MLIATRECSSRPEGNINSLALIQDSVDILFGTLFVFIGAVWLRRGYLGEPPGGSIITLNPPAAGKMSRCKRIMSMCAGAIYLVLGLIMVSTELYHRYR